MINGKDQTTDSFMTRRFVYIWLLPEVMSFPSAKWDSVLVHVLSVSAKAALEERLSENLLTFCYSGTGVNDQIIHSYISALFRFYSCFCCCFILKHRRKYQLKLLIISLVVFLCSVQQQVYLFSFFWGCSCNSLMGENKPPPAVGSYRRKISQSLEERIMLHIPQHWEKEDEGWRVLCWAGGRDCLGEIAKSESHWPASNNQEPFWTLNSTAIVHVFK